MQLFTVFVMATLCLVSCLHACCLYQSVGKKKEVRTYVGRSHGGDGDLNCCQCTRLSW